jgi:surfactin synthase thioesterase subunit
MSRVGSIRLYLFPFAGGSSYSYRFLEGYLPSFIERQPIELPGRGRRTDEEPLDVLEEAVEDAFTQIRKSMSGPYAIYGHSLGSLMGYLTARRLAEAGLSAPRHLFLTGSAGPAAPRRRPPLHGLDRAAFFESLRELGGCPREVLDNEEIMDFYEPILRADFKMVECYRHQPGEPIDVPMQILYADREEIEAGEIDYWKRETRAEVGITCLPGDHFFIYPHAPRVARLISQSLQQYV